MYEIIDTVTGETLSWSETITGALAKVPRRDGTVEVRLVHERPGSLDSLMLRPVDGDRFMASPNETRKTDD